MFTLVIYCPKLPVPDNAELSTMDVVYDTVVTVTCNTGFKTFDDQLVKSVICLDECIWNDTITNCQRTNEFILVEFAIKGLLLLLLLLLHSVSKNVYNLLCMPY